MSRVPEDEWPGGGDQEVIDAIKLDFLGEWGDRRQEREWTKCIVVWLSS